MAHRRRSVGVSLAGAGHGAYLLLEADGARADLVEADAQAMGEACLATGGADVLMAASPARQKELWSVRRAIGEAVRRIAPYKEEDTVVPRRQVPQLLEAVDGIVRRHGLRALCYGHAGDGNIHVNILRPDSPPGSRDASAPAWGEALEPAIRELFTAVAALGGKISGEHGIGWVQRGYMPLAHDAVGLDVMGALKRAFDPLGILNPGKVLPDT